MAVVTPSSGRKKKRPQSAPSARSGRELWLNAVKNRQTGTILSLECINTISLIYLIKSDWIEPR